jgi:organic radical activating enzyme
MYCYYLNTIHSPKDAPPELVAALAEILVTTAEIAAAENNVVSERTTAAAAIEAANAELSPTATPFDVSPHSSVNSYDMHLQQQQQQQQLQQQLHKRINSTSSSSARVTEDPLPRRATATGAFGVI